jgi:predicted permease
MPSAETRGLLRSLRRDPAFLAASVLTLGLGIGAGTAVFSLFKAVVLSALPWPESDRLLLLWNRPSEGATSLGFSSAELDAFRGSESLEGLAGFFPGGANLVLGERARQLWVTSVTPGALETLGVRPLHGRSFRPGDHERSGPVILSHELWSDAFGSDPGAVGRLIKFDGAEREIVGVLPPGIAMPTDYRWAGQTEIWSPVPREELLAGGSPTSRPFWAVAKAREGASPESVHAALDIVHRRLQTARPDAYPGGAWRIDVVPVETEVLGSARRSLTMLAIAVALVLAVAASNQALLLAARDQARRRELAVRSALGATPRRLAANGLLEAMAVASIGALAGLALAGAAIAAVPALAPGVFPRSDRIAMDWGVAAFAFALALAVALAVGGREGRRQRNLSEELAAGRRATGSSRGAPHRFLLALEIALSTVLVAGAAMLLQSLGNLRAAPIGFEPAGVATGDIVLPEQRYGNATEIFRFFEQVRERVGRIPGVEQVGWTTTVPFWNPAGTREIEIEPVGRDSRPKAIVAFDAIGPGLIGAMGTPLLGGRDVEETDREGAPPVALVNRAFEQRFWPGGSALGRRVRLPGKDSRNWVTIVGVLENVRDQSVSEPPRARISIPFRQLPDVGGEPSRYLSVMARTRTDAASLVGPLRAAVAAVDAEVPLGAARTLASEVRSALSRPRLAARLTSAFAAAALLLVLAGLYGLMSASVARRFREIGIRLALGASRRAVIGLVFRDGLAPVVLGVAAGAAGAAAVSRLLRTLLYDVGTADPASLLAAVAGILGVALLSSALPVSRAFRADPAATMRQE